LKNIATKAFVSAATLIIMVPASTVLASTTLSTPPIPTPVIEESTSSTNNFNTNVIVVSSNEVDFVVTNNGKTIKAVAINNGSTVTTTYYLNNTLIYTSTENTSQAEKIGEDQKGGIVALPPANSVPPSGAEHPASIPSGDYYFDGMVYSPAGVNRPYAHPDKGYYGISPYVTWHRVGNQDLHCQIDYYDSQSILEAPAWAVGSGVGALVGGMVTDGNLTGSVIGAIIGGALGAYYGAQVERLADENGCIWFTIDNNPPIVNLGTWWAPEWYMDVRYIELGPWATTNFYYYLGGVY